MENNNFAIILVVIVGIVAIVGIAAFFISSQQTQVLMGPTASGGLSAVDDPFPDLPGQCEFNCLVDKIACEMEADAALTVCENVAIAAAMACLDEAINDLRSGLASCFSQHTGCQRHFGESDKDYVLRCWDSCISDLCVECKEDAKYMFMAQRLVCQALFQNSDRACKETRDDAYAQCQQQLEDCLAGCNGGVPR